MARRLVHDLAYDAPVAEVAAMLRDPAFREEVCEYQHVRRHTVTVTPVGDGTEITIDQVQAARGIPSFALKFVGDEINIVQREIWTSETLGDIFVSIPGKPGEMTGTLRLTESGTTTTETVDLTIKVGIPLLGGKIEGVISDLMLKALEAERAVGHDYLSR